MPPRVQYHGPASVSPPGMHRKSGSRGGRLIEVGATRPRRWGWAERDGQALGRSTNRLLACEGEADWREAQDKRLAAAPTAALLVKTRIGPAGAPRTASIFPAGRSTRRAAPRNLGLVEPDLLRTTAPFSKSQHGDWPSTWGRAEVDVRRLLADRGREDRHTPTRRCLPTSARRVAGTSRAAARGRRIGGRSPAGRRDLGDGHNRPAPTMSLSTARSAVRACRVGLRAPPAFGRTPRSA